jgi:parallel beta-helix repeat protein
MVNTTLQGAQATVNGGGVVLLDRATLCMSNSMVSECKANEDGGGLHLAGSSELVLQNSTVKGNEAGPVKEPRRTGMLSGGGISAGTRSRVVLQGATILNNKALMEGGGLSLYGNATLAVLGPTRVTNNTAYTVGGGLQLSSPNFSPTVMTDLVMVRDNSAPYAADVSVLATSLKLVDDGGADSVAAPESMEALLVVTLNVSGTQGLPSEDLVSYALYTDAKEYLGSFSVNTSTEGKLRKLPVRFKYPPGESWPWILRGFILLFVLQ